MPMLHNSATTKEKRLRPRSHAITYHTLGCFVGRPRRRGARLEAAGAASGFLSCLFVFQVKLLSKNAPLTICR